MNDDFIPGGSQCWVLFAARVPLVMIIFGVIFLVNLGYSDEGQWDEGQWT